MVTSGWEPTEHRDTVVHAAWSALDGLIRDALIETTMRAHGYDMGTAERHFAGNGPDDETTVLWYWLHVYVTRYTQIRT